MSFYKKEKFWTFFLLLCECGCVGTYFWVRLGGNAQPGPNGLWPIRYGVAAWCYLGKFLSLEALSCCRNLKWGGGPRLKVVLRKYFATRVQETPDWMHFFSWTICQVWTKSERSFSLGVALVHVLLLIISNYFCKLLSRVVQRSKARFFLRTNNLAGTWILNPARLFVRKKKRALDLWTTLLRSLQK